MSISKSSEATQVASTQAWYPAAMLGWRLPRKVAYIQASATPRALPLLLESSGKHSGADDRSGSNLPATGCLR
jgi:hypothetical protein